MYKQEVVLPMTNDRVHISANAYFISTSILRYVYDGHIEDYDFFDVHIFLRCFQLFRWYNCIIFEFILISTMCILFEDTKFRQRIYVMEVSEYFNKDYFSDSTDLCYITTIPNCSVLFIKVYMTSMTESIKKDTFSYI